MLAILNSLNAHNFPIFQPILMILVSKLMVYGALSDKTYLSLGLLSPLIRLHHIHNLPHYFLVGIMIFVICFLKKKKEYNFQTVWISQQLQTTKYVAGR